MEFIEFKMTCGFCDAVQPMPEKWSLGKVYECLECRQKFRFVDLNNGRIGMQKVG